MTHRPQAIRTVGDGTTAVLAFRDALNKPDFSDVTFKILGPTSSPSNSKHVDPSPLPPPSSPPATTTNSKNSNKETQKKSKSGSRENVEEQQQQQEQQEQQQTIIHAHRAILAARSPVFKEMFFGGYPESSQKVVIVEDFKFEHFMIILEWAYAGSASMSARDVLGVLQAANYYGLDDLMIECRDLAQSFIDEENVLHLLEHASSLGETSLVVQCLNFIKSHAHAVLTSPVWLTVSAECVERVLSLPAIDCEEALLFDQAMAWLEANTSLRADVAATMAAAAMSSSSASKKNKKKNKKDKKKKNKKKAGPVPEESGADTNAATGAESDAPAQTDNNNNNNSADDDTAPAPVQQAEEEEAEDHHQQQQQQQHTDEDESGDSDEDDEDDDDEEDEDEILLPGLDSVASFGGEQQQAAGEVAAAAATSPTARSTKKDSPSSSSSAAAAAAAATTSSSSSSAVDGTTTGNTKLESRSLVRRFFRLLRLSHLSVTHLLDRVRPLLLAHPCVRPSYVAALEFLVSPGHIATVTQVPRAPTVLSTVQIDVSGDFLRGWKHLVTIPQSTSTGLGFNQSQMIPYNFFSDVPAHAAYLCVGEMVLGREDAVSVMAVGCIRIVRPIIGSRTPVVAEDGDICWHASQTTFGFTPRNSDGGSGGGGGSWRNSRPVASSTPSARARAGVRFQVLPPTQAPSLSNMVQDNDGGVRSGKKFIYYK